MAEGKKSDRVRSIDPAAIEMLKVADERGIETMFHRAETGSICPTGAEGGCCKVCYMGPCRFIGKDKNEKRGVCGASLGTVVARNYLRECAGRGLRPRRPRP